MSVASAQCCVKQRASTMVASRQSRLLSLEHVRFVLQAEQIA